MILKCNCSDCRATTNIPPSERVSEGAISRPLEVLGNWLMGGDSGQDLNRERSPLI